MRSRGDAAGLIDWSTAMAYEEILHRELKPVRIFALER